MEIKQVIEYAIIVLGFIVSYWKQRLDMEKRVTKLTTDLEARKSGIMKLEDVVEKILERRDAFEKETFKQFGDIQLQLTKAITILNENLKHLTQIVDGHNEQIQKLLDNQNKK